MSNDMESSSLEAFRKHRHDVLNSLQLVTGYLQVSNPDRAMGALKSLVTWLHSLSAWQREFAANAPIVWQAAASPHVFLLTVQGKRQLDTSREASLIAALAWLESQSQEFGIMRMDIDIRMACGDDVQAVCVDVISTPSIANWWQRATLGGNDLPHFDSVKIYVTDGSRAAE